MATLDSLKLLQVLRLQQEALDKLNCCLERDSCPDGCCVSPPPADPEVSAAEEALADLEADFNYQQNWPRE